MMTFDQLNPMLLITIFIDRVAKEIIRLVASVCVRLRLFVCVCACVSVCCGHSPV